MPAQTKGLAVVQFPVSDLERSLSWYQAVLGVPLTFPYTPGDNDIWLNLGESGFGLSLCKDVPKLEFLDANGNTQGLVQFHVENIHDLHKELLEKGVTISEMQYKQGGGYSFTCIDPDGHIIGIWGGWPKEELE